MNATPFHRTLFGNGSKAPEGFQLSDVHKALYDAFDAEGKHGFSSASLLPDRFLATIVLALALTDGIRPVYVAIPKRHFKWALDQVENIARQVMRIRKKDKGGINIMRAAFGQLRMTSDILKEPEPDRWVMFGFANGDIVPPWAEGRLLELEEPRPAEVRETPPVPLPTRPKMKPELENPSK